MRTLVPRSAVAVSAFLFAVACSTVGSQTPSVEASGPPDVDPAAVASHSDQIAEIGPRPAGSQEEQAASTYVLAHLQSAGYVVRLDSVPVADQVHSTNVEALPPDGGDPEIVVVAAYDSTPGKASDGRAIGLLLEVARALRVRAPEHSVAFVALGGEHATVQGGRLGSRRLANDLLDEGLEPVVVELFPGGDVATVVGSLADDISVAAPGSERPPLDVFARAGFDSVQIVGGDVGATGRALLEFLAARAG